MGDLKYPCETCTRVKDPDKCKRMNCCDWVDWFLSKWEELRALWLT